MAEMPAEPGWYRLGDHGWDPVDANDAAEELMAGDGWDLTYVDPGITTMAETPLF
jgi:hypothetical protein